MKTQFLTVAAFLCAALSTTAAAAPSGGSIFFQTDNPAAYVQLLKSETKLFKASGALQRGVCFNSTGMTEAGRGWTYAFYPSMESALAGADALVDPRNADVVDQYRAISQFRGSAHYSAIRPHPRSLPSSTARNMAVQVDDVMGYVEVLEMIEKAGKEGGLDVAFSAYVPMGAGPLFNGAHGTLPAQADVLIHVDAPTSAELGKFFDMLGSTEAGQKAYAAAAKTNRKIVMDQIVRCMNTNTAM